ncbi:unnamed protein product [Mycena citricolor]|uniref:Uncharacterized protein n=1 Tax=Mycena citricolor TaxID=2018698 RepID=A0AAD2JW09_9AGAR|nr:unnamed protein product [Mycena citricolor]
MTRSTRSSDKQQVDLKKRKRISDGADEPANKHQRTDIPAYAAKQPISSEEAGKILDVLQHIDSQGLLDRVYPLDSTSPSSTSSNTYSLRTLLSNSQDYSLATLKTAVQNLLPISIQPRVPPPPTAAQQQRFCDLAFSLLDQASFRPVSLEEQSLLPEEQPGESSAKPVGTTSKQYALLQHLPGGDYWSSLANDGVDPRDLATGHAELVALFPAPVDTTTPVAKLGAYVNIRNNVPSRVRKPGIKVATSGAFLDYGPYGSFAPVWVQEGREIGMRQTAEVYAQRAQRYREKLLARQRIAGTTQPNLVETTEKEGVGNRTTPEEEADDDDMPTVEEQKEEQPTASNAVDEMEDILSSDQIASLKSLLSDLELENQVQELLVRNRRALQRLGQLQVDRLREGRTAESLSEGDEELELGNSSESQSESDIIPPPKTLHRLMQTLPRIESHGWRGTLPDRTPGPIPAALHDDSTVKVRPGVPAVAPAPAAVPQYSGYYPTQAGAAPYRYNGTAYTPAAYAATPNGVRTPVQGQHYYPSQATTVPYGYPAGSGWYGNYVPAQPQQTASYSSFFGGATMMTGTPTGTPAPAGKAVANTVLGKSVYANYGQGQFAYAGAAGTQATPVLPSHLRSAVYQPGMQTPG